MRRLALPLALMAMVSLSWLLAAYGALPPWNVLTDWFTDWIISHGWLAITGIAILENTAFISIYFPGSIVILGIMASTSGNPATALYIFFAIYLGQALGLTASYALGRIFAEERDHVIRRSNLLILALSTFWHPHGASTTSMYLGTARRCTLDLLIIYLACFAWSCFWGAAMYFGLGQIVNEFGWDWITFCGAAVWLVVELVRKRFPHAAAA